jgi:hypothetical protein
VRSVRLRRQHKSERGEHALKIWSVDADDMTDINDTLLYETPWIGNFLAPDSTSRFLVVATKGFGKTLLLRTKRLRLEGARQGIHLLPENSLTDKAFGLANVFSKQDVKRVGEDPLFWTTAWLMAITMAVLKVARRHGDDGSYPLKISEFESKLGELLEGPLRTITDLFTQVLSFSPKEHYKGRQDLQRHLGPAFRGIHTPVIAFIDNVDEHFNAHLKPLEYGSQGATDKTIWYHAQIGLATAIRELHPQNHHVKIYASIRSEAFSRLLSDSPIAQQLEGSALKIEYQREDLRQIFIRNLLAEPDENCVSPHAEDPFERFFGPEGLRLDHSHVGEVEDIWDYIARHTLGRPRDLMTVGSALSRLSPATRTQANIRRAVNEASETIGTAYLNEIKPHLATEIDFPLLFELIYRNVLTQDQLKDIATRYNEHANANQKGEHPYVHVFCSLFKAGLLGYVMRDVGIGADVQKFKRPGNYLFDADGILPPASSHYIIHPALDEHIRLRAKQYTHDTLNIAGHGRRWRDSGGASGVIKADVVGYSRILSDPELSRTFTEYFERLVRRACARLDSHKIEGGDTIILIDRNPANLVVAIKEIARDLRSGKYKAELRAGAEFGVTNVPGGPVFRTAARLETVSMPGALCVTREFRDEVNSIDDRVGFDPSQSLNSLTKLERRGEAYNIRKSEADPDLFKEIFALSLR